MVVVKMPSGDGPVQPRRFEFNDRSDLFQYLRALAGALDIVKYPTAAIPELVEFVERVSSESRVVASHFEPWRELLGKPAMEIAAQVLAEGPEGERLRYSMPFFPLWLNEDIDRISYETSRLWREASGADDCSDDEMAWLDRIAVGMMRMSVDENYRQQVAQRLS